MERGESVLDSVFEDENLEDFEDVEMLDVEEGELVEQNPNAKHGERSDSTDVKTGDIEGHNGNRGQRKNKKKKKNKRKRGGSGQNVTNINRFVVDTCRRLKEKKSYLVWTAVGVLGVSALNDLVKEVDAIQACGGQKTADGKRYRSGGGVLWNILKVRDPNAYREIMKKGKEFEKQFKPEYIKQEPVLNEENFSERTTFSATGQTTVGVLDALQQASHVQHQPDPSKGEQKRAPIHDRVRMPVTYDDLLEGENPKDE